MAKASDNLVERVRGIDRELREHYAFAADCAAEAATRIEKLQAALLEAGEALALARIPAASFRARLEPHELARIDAIIELIRLELGRD